MKVGEQLIDARVPNRHITVVLPVAPAGLPAHRWSILKGYPVRILRFLPNAVIDVLLKAPMEQHKICELGNKVPIMVNGGLDGTDSALKVHL
jgi:hypothetical protein